MASWRTILRTTEILLQVFSTSQYLSEVLIRDPELLDWLQGGPERRDRSALIDDLWKSVAGLDDEDGQRLALRRFRQRESLRIGYNDIVRGFPLEVIDPGPLGPGRRLRRGGRAAGPGPGRGSVRACP